MLSTAAAVPCGSPSSAPKSACDGTLPVTRVRVRLLWAELLPMPGQHRHIAHSADLAKDLHPPEAPSLGHLQGEVLQPYVTVEVHGGGRFRCAVGDGKPLDNDATYEDGRGFIRVFFYIDGFELDDGNLKVIP